MAAALVLLTGCTSAQRSTGSDDGSPSSMTVPSTSGTTSTTGSAAQHWVVTLGDSYISGQGARWAGNTSGRPGPVDALGADAYGDEGGPAGPGCGRARMSLADLTSSSPLRGKNLACSGATIASHGTGRSFVPGLDRYDDGRGHVGQLVALQRFAAHHDVTDVVVSIGGNDFGFGAVLARCVSTFVSTVTRVPAYCRHDPAVTAPFTTANAAAISQRIGSALTRVAGAMGRAGHRTSDYTIVVDTYPSPVASGDRIRYREVLLQRLFVGGCPLFDADATWANRVALPTINGAISDAVVHSALPNLVEVDLTRAFDGHRLCEVGSHQLQETRPALTSWRSPAAKSQLEWVNELYTKQAPWRAVESFHPNFWGTLAERRCLTSALSVGQTGSGQCRDGHFLAP